MNFPFLYATQILIMQTRSTLASTIVGEDGYVTGLVFNITAGIESPAFQVFLHYLQIRIHISLH